ncbi:MAG TPA: lipid A deacylase LpxR family protein [Alphaproteobacteria bacterium]
MMLVAALLAAPPAAAENGTEAKAKATDDGSTITLQFENDRVANTDRNYTNGWRITWLSGAQELPDWAERLGPLIEWPTFMERKPETRISRRVGIGVGQDIYTPTDTAARDPQPNDRPYAAWLYATLALQSGYTNDEGTSRLDTFEIDLGVVGPYALGEQVQNGFHEIINSPQANGWDHQLPNEPAFVVALERKWRQPVIGATPADDWGVDVLPFAGAYGGTVLTAFSGGAIVRFGQGLDRDFGAPRFRPNMASSLYFQSERGLAWYVFGGADGRAVLHNIFLDGSTFRHSPRVDKNTFVVDYHVGAALVWGDWRLSYTQVFRGREYEGQEKADRFGALSISYRF